jgi:lipopolysaccharide/colanic/teichoic acid biosynthesis glycosyltransferase
MTKSALAHNDNMLLLEEPAAAAFTPAYSDRDTIAPSSLGSSKAALRLRLYAALIAIDASIVFFAFAIANLVRFGDPLHGQGMDMLVVLLPIFLGIAINSRTYSLDTLASPRQGMRRALKSFAFAVAAVIGIIFYLKTSADFSRAVMAVGTSTSFVLIAFGRPWLSDKIGRRCDWRFTTDVLLVDGVSIPPTHDEIVLYAARMGLSPSDDDPVILNRVGQLLKNCDHVILACPVGRRTAWAAMLRGLGVDVEIFAPELDQMGALAVRHRDNRSTILVSRGPLGLRDRVLKRSLDLTLTLPAMIVLAPLFLAIALAIKLDSPGPVFFRQPRIGLGNRMFDMIKYRSMRVDMLDANGSQHTLQGDQRVTKVGAFLRRTSLDELPQLLNVLMDDMSLVGPRPHPLGALAGGSLFWEVEKNYWHRHAIKPGLTGLAQVRGFRGSTFEHLDLSNRLQADLEYLTEWTIWRDIAIIAATARVLMHRNAF